jgi:hypothetical protein
VQGEKMNNPPVNIVDSILNVKASGNAANAHDDLLLPEGKSIAQLLYEEENKDKQESQEN